MGTQPPKNVYTLFKTVCTWLAKKCVSGFQKSVNLASKKCEPSLQKVCTSTWHPKSVYLVLASKKVSIWSLKKCGPGLRKSVYLVSNKVCTWPPKKCVSGLKKSVYLASKKVCIWPLKKCVSGLKKSVHLVLVSKKYVPGHQNCVPGL